MAKTKTHRASAKKFRRTGTGKLRRYKAYEGYIAGKKSPKRIRNFRKGSLVDRSNQEHVDHMIP